jgi:two-component system phosphate regulon sensor histidine kinase PhoR
VKHIVNRHRGYLTVDSTMGEGTVFKVYLPSDLRPFDPGTRDALS